MRAFQLAQHEIGVSETSFTAGLNLASPYSWSRRTIPTQDENGKSTGPEAQPLQWLRWHTSVSSPRDWRGEDRHHPDPQPQSTMNLDSGYNQFYQSIGSDSTSPGVLICISYSRSTSNAQHWSSCPLSFQFHSWPKPSFSSCSRSTCYVMFPVTIDWITTTLHAVSLYDTGPALALKR